MFRRVISRLVLVGLIASLLGLAHPARAEAAELSAPRLLWDWLASLWDSGISTLGGGGQAAIDKEGASLDPNGTPTQGGSTSNTSPPTGTTQGDAGPGIDPNG
jgi:hypothetical protein